MVVMVVMVMVMVQKTERKTFGGARRTMPYRPPPPLQAEGAAEFRA